MKKATLVSLTLVFLAAVLHGDVITLKTGDKIEGKIRAKTEAAIIVEYERGKYKNVSRSEIDSIAEKPFDFPLSDADGSRTKTKNGGMEDKTQAKKSSDTKPAEHNAKEDKGEMRDGSSLPANTPSGAVPGLTLTITKQERGKIEMRTGMADALAVWIELKTVKTAEVDLAPDNVRLEGDVPSNQGYFFSKFEGAISLVAVQEGSLEFQVYGGKQVYRINKGAFRLKVAGGKCARGVLVFPGAPPSGHLAMSFPGAAPVVLSQ